MGFKTTDTHRLPNIYKETMNPENKFFLFSRLPYKNIFCVYLCLSVVSILSESLNLLYGISKITTGLN
jgi:hypothetical protein